MSFVLLIMGILLLQGVRFENCKSFNRDYMSYKQTRIIEGVFVLFVLMSHYKNDYLIPGWADTIYLNIASHLGQGIVAMFFFYSGYGIMLNIRCRGYEYIKKLPVRLGKLVFQMTLAVSIFALFQLVRGETYPVTQYLLACIGWSSVGNSNWFIIMTLALYVMMFVAFVWRTERDYDSVKLSVFTGLTIACVFICRKFQLPYYYYDTLLVFPLGSWYAFLKNRIEPFVMHNNKSYYGILSVFVIVYILLAKYRDESFAIYTMWTLVFALSIVLFSMKITLSSPFFAIIGQHVFSIYILQRIPMILLKDCGLTQNYTYLGFILTFVITCIIAWLFDCLFKIVWNRLPLVRKSNQSE